MVFKSQIQLIKKLKWYTFVYCAGTDGNTCRQKSREDEKQLMTDLEWPYRNTTSVDKGFVYSYQNNFDNEDLLTTHICGRGSLQAMNYE